MVAIDMGPQETLKSYNDRYWETLNEIGEWLSNLAIAQYNRGFLIENRLRDSLTMMPP